MMCSNIFQFYAIVKCQAAAAAEGMNSEFQLQNNMSTHVHRSGSITVTNANNKNYNNYNNNYNNNLSTVSATDLLDSYLYESEANPTKPKEQDPIWKRSLARALAARSSNTYHIDRHGRTTTTTTTKNRRHTPTHGHLEPRSAVTIPLPTPQLSLNSKRKQTTTHLQQHHLHQHQVMTTEQELYMLEQERTLLMKESSHLLDSHGIHDSVRTAFQIDDSFLYENEEQDLLDLAGGEEEEDSDINIHEISDDEVLASLSPERSNRMNTSTLHTALVQLYEDFSSGLSLGAVVRDHDASLLMEEDDNDDEEGNYGINNGNNDGYNAYSHIGNENVIRRDTHNIQQHQRVGIHKHAKRRRRRQYHHHQQHHQQQRHTTTNEPEEEILTSDSMYSSDEEEELERFRRRRRRKRRDRQSLPHEEEQQQHRSDKMQKKRVRFRDENETDNKNNASNSKHSVAPSKPPIDNGEGIAPPGPQSNTPKSPMKTAKNTLVVSTLTGTTKNGKKETKEISNIEQNTKTEQETKEETKEFNVPMPQKPNAGSPLSPPQRKLPLTNTTTSLFASTKPTTTSDSTIPTPPTTSAPTVSHAAVTAASTATNETPQRNNTIANKSTASSSISPNQEEETKTTSLLSTNPMIGNLSNFTGVARRQVASPQRATALPSPQKRPEERKDNSNEIADNEQEEEIKGNSCMSGTKKQGGTGGSASTPLFVNEEDGGGLMVHRPSHVSLNNSGTTGGQPDRVIPRPMVSSGGSNDISEVALNAGTATEAASHMLDESMEVVRSAGGGGGTTSLSNEIDDNDDNDDNDNDNNNDNNDNNDNGNALKEEESEKDNVTKDEETKEETRSIETKERNTLPLSLSPPVILLNIPSTPMALSPFVAPSPLLPITKIDSFEIDMASVLAGVQQIVMRRIFDELPCDETNSVRVRALILSLRNDSEMSDALDLQINIRDETSGKRKDIDAVLSCIPCDGSTTITWRELMYRFSSSEETRASVAKQEKQEEDHHQQDHQQHQQHQQQQATEQKETFNEEVYMENSTLVVSPDRKWFDRLDTAVSGTPNGMTPTGRRLMEHHQAISSVTESQLHLSTLNHTLNHPLNHTLNPPLINPPLNHTTTPPTNKNKEDQSIKHFKNGRTLTTMTPNGQELQERASMAARAQGLIRGLTRTPPSTLPTPNDLMSRMSSYAAGSITTSVPKEKRSVVSIPPQSPMLSSSLSSTLQGRYGDVPYRDAIRTIRENTASVSNTTTSVPNQPPTTPEAVRDLFAYHRRMTQPRKQDDDLMELSPMKSPFRNPSLLHSEHKEVENRDGQERMGRTSDRNSPNRNRKQKSPVRSPLRSPLRRNGRNGTSTVRTHSPSRVAAVVTAAASFNPSFSSTLSSSMMLPLSTSSEEPASPLLTANAAGASRSAAMELLSSLRASLNRNDPSAMNFRESPNKAWMRTPIREIPRVPSPATTTATEAVDANTHNHYYDEGGNGRDAIRRMMETTSNISIPEVRETTSSLLSPTPNSVSKSLDTVTKSALDVLSRLRRTNQTLFEPSTQQIGSPSFSYLSASPTMRNTNESITLEENELSNVSTGSAPGISNLLGRTEMTVLNIMHPPPLPSTTFTDRVNELLAESKIETTKEETKKIDVQSLDLSTIARLKERASDLAAIARADAILNNDEDDDDDDVGDVGDVGDIDPNLDVSPPPLHTLGLSTIARLKVRASDLAAIAKADAILNNDDDDDN